MPAEFKEFLDHIKALEYADKPDYNVRIIFFLLTLDIRFLLRPFSISLTIYDYP